jgi:hypothetical protein
MRLFYSLPNGAKIVNTNFCNGQDGLARRISFWCFKHNFEIRSRLGLPFLFSLFSVASVK